MNKNYNTELKKGKLLPLIEEFYTIQGEGFHTGKPAYFIRIGGCDVGCNWCDVKLSWNAKDFPPVRADEIIERAACYPAKAVVVTGGEPSLYNLDYFTKELKKKGIKTFVETSGSHKLTGMWDWICLSPKQQFPPRKEIYLKANELKVIIQDKDDFEWAENNAEMINENCYLFLQPEWSARRKILPEIIDYVKNNPKWRISLQSHKYIGIP
ncbi:MAG: 7-carboxy-7-deazaguanine synthase QueE [Bacteroidetes bacterium]|nr:7-carboxy-7-deazaguanine synthase QueE [Bacteroidota bacterium]MCK4406992.1 7-carboxy-7-deazaguanine synthase QueE [Bacteroidales bacterium]